MTSENWDDLEKDFKGRLKKSEQLARHSSLRIGGPARYWVEVQSTIELQQVLELARKDQLPVEVVGLGSNVLFPDEGIDGVVVRFVGDLASVNFSEPHHDEVTVEVGAGMINAHLVRKVLKQGWIGAEFLVLIPGTFGGAVAMNAGTKETELASILVDVEWVNRDEPRKVESMSAQNLKMSYRHCALPSGAVVTKGRIRLTQGDVDAAWERVSNDKDRRNETQPYKLASVGSTFANPEGDYAGRLIEEVGLKGFSVGGAEISQKHANFFINRDQASAQDFLTLMATARVKVREAFGVELRPEVQFVGFDGWAAMRQIEEGMA